MRRVGHLFEKVIDFDMLRRAARRAARGKRGAEPSRFLSELEREVLRLREELSTSRWRPGPYRSFVVNEPKPRLISAAPFRDRVVHHALCAAMEPVLERFAIFDSYACRRGKGTLAAIARAQTMTRRASYFLKLDIRKFFESARHADLNALLRRLLKDARLLALCDQIIAHGGSGAGPAAAVRPESRGLPIGNLTSQHFANLYLGPLDHFILEHLRPIGYVRYMDDLLLFGAKEVLRKGLRDIDARTRAMGLELKEEVTVLAPVREGVPFLGFRVWPHLVRMDRFRRKRFLRTLRALGELDELGAARRGSGLMGWALHANTHSLRASVLDDSARLRHSPLRA